MSDPTKDKKPFPVAAILFIIYGVLYLVHYIDRTLTFDIIKTFDYSFEDIVIEISWLISVLIPLILGIVLLIAKKNNIILSILISVLLLDKLYFFFVDIKRFLATRTDTLNSVFYILLIATFTILLLFCILSMVSKNQVCKFLSAWFVPGILYATSFGVYLATIIITSLGNPYYFDDFIIYHCSNLFLKLLFVPAVFLFGHWLYKENKYNTLTEKTY